MQKYRHLHLWLLIPFTITLWGFFPSYWLKFPKASWLHHLHGLSATSWYLLVILQPYLATRGRLKLHRQLGLVGLLLAGLVVASGLAVIPGNIAAAKLDGEFPVAPDAFLYGISLVDLVSIIGFAVSVVVAVLKAKQVDEHAIWMVATVFWPFMAALARVAVSLTIMVRGGPEGVTFINVVFWLTLPFLGVLGYLCYRIRRAHPALVAVMIGHLLMFVIEPIGNSPAWRVIAATLFKS
jgi:uncharacterized membrane protein